MNCRNGFNIKRKSYFVEFYINNLLCLQPPKAKEIRKFELKKLFQKRGSAPPQITGDFRIRPWPKRYEPEMRDLMSVSA